jgi:hypothetical protein
VSLNQSNPESSARSTPGSADRLTESAMLQTLEALAKAADPSLENGARRAIWTLSRDIARANPPASRHLAEIASGRWPALEPIALPDVVNLFLATFAAAKACSALKLEHFNATEPERRLACVILADEVSRILARRQELESPLQGSHSAT